MDRLARPVNAGTPLSLVSKAAARPSRWPRSLSQSRIPGPRASWSIRSPLGSLAAAFAAIRRVDRLDSPCMWVGAPATSRSASATRSQVASATGTRVTSQSARRPSAMLLAMTCVLPYIDS